MKSYNSSLRNEVKHIKNITINLPECYEENIQKLIGMKIVASRSEAIRTAIREFLHSEYKNLQILGYFN